MINCTDCSIVFHVHMLFSYLESVHSSYPSIVWIYLCSYNHRSMNILRDIYFSVWSDLPITLNLFICVLEHISCLKLFNGRQRCKKNQNINILFSVKTSVFFLIGVSGGYSFCRKWHHRQADKGVGWLSSQVPFHWASYSIWVQHHIRAYCESILRHTN